MNLNNPDALDVSSLGGEKQNFNVQSDPLGYITDMRENDVPYAMRCGIDLNLRVGAWFVVSPIDVLNDRYLGLIHIGHPIVLC